MALVEYCDTVDLQLNETLATPQPSAAAGGESQEDIAPSDESNSDEE